jgi:hypothetical protein
MVPEVVGVLHFARPLLAGLPLRIDADAKNCNSKPYVRSQDFKLPGSGNLQ